MASDSTPPRRLADRYKSSCSNIWVEFNKLAKKHAVVNLGQGMPDYAPSEYIQRTLSEVVMEGNKYLQYASEQGHLRLRKAVASLHGPLIGRDIDPESEVIITHGAYESLQCCFLGLLNPGDEVILIEPYYDAYRPMAESANAIPVFIPLRPSVSAPKTSKDWKLDPDELAQKFSPKTKMIVLNTPSNPIGKVFTIEELQVIADLCIKHDVVCVSDEVYEWLVYAGMEHVRIATLPGMFERTITISSASKSFSVTGWRVGWSIASKDLITCLMVSHQNGDCSCTTPAQEAIARCIEYEMKVMGSSGSHLTVQRDQLQQRRDKLLKILKDAGFIPCVPDAGYFILADWSNFLPDPQAIEDGSKDSVNFKFAKWLVREVKISAIPPAAFYTENMDLVKTMARFCFFKTDEAMEKAAELLKQSSRQRV